MAEITMVGADLLPWQREVTASYINDDYKTHVLNTSRQIGKSLLISQLVLYSAINNDKVDVGIVSLTYKQVKLIYANISESLKSTPLVKSDNKSELKIELVNGSRITFLTVQNPDNIRGHTFDYLFCDEFAYYPVGAWQKVIQPTTLVKGKKTVLASTPRGTQNDFYDLFNAGLNPQEESITCFTYDYTHGIFDEAEIETIRRQLPAAIFNAEYLCQFTENGSVFNNVGDISILDNWGRYDSTKSYYVGIDVALFTDYAVAVCLDDQGNVVDVYRERTGSMANLNSQLETFYNKWKPRKTLIELNNQGVSVFEHMHYQFRGVEGFKTTAVSKPELIHELQRSIEEKAIRIPTTKLFAPLYDELTNFSFSYSQKSKQILYAALPGKHDDTVIALSLANKLYSQYHSVSVPKRKIAFRIG
jgi:hypothetical protein